MKVITCFSYKGGSGRTVASANIAAALASAQSVAAIEKPLDFKVAILDLDVFSAGTHRVFEISNAAVQGKGSCVQDFLLGQVDPATYAEAGICLDDEVMRGFGSRGAQGNCRSDLTLFPAKPQPDRRFIVAKYHENLLLELIVELERREFDYVVLDGEAGTRAMADIAIRLSDIVLMFFRLTWQHVEGTYNVAKFFKEREDSPSVYLIPSCVPLIGEDDGIYQVGASGLEELKDETRRIPRDSKLEELIEQDKEGMGYFYSQGLFIHDSLILKGGERILVYDSLIDRDRAASDYYRIARELSELHKPR